MKLKCSHVSTCLPDYWGGHAKAHISVPVYSGMKADELRKVLKKEVDPCGIAGADARFYDNEPEHDAGCWDAAEKAIDELHIPDGPLFLGLASQCEDDDCSVYAYFIFEDDE